MKRGDHVGPYEIVERLGGRHETEIYSATRGSGLVAIKIAGSTTAIELVGMKARIAMLASHPNLVHAIDVGESGPLPFIVMEHLTGVHLSSVLARGSPIHPGTASAITRAIAEALHHLHTLASESGLPLGVLHLDVNADHIFLGRDGAVKLIDYGMIGDRIDANRPIGPSYDIFALGSLLSEMVRETADQYLYRIIARATSLDAEERFETAAAMADALNVHLLSNPNFWPELAIRQLMSSTLESRALSDPSLSVGDIFVSDTRVRSVDFKPVPKPTIWGPLFWISFGVAIFAVVAFSLYRLLLRH